MSTESEESWESASEFEYHAEERVALNERMQQNKMSLLRRMVGLVQAACAPRDCFVVGEVNEHEKVRRIRSGCAGYEGVAFEGAFLCAGLRPGEISEVPEKIEESVAFFRNLLANRIKARLYFVLSKETDAFVEYFVGDHLVEHGAGCRGCVVSVDADLNIADQTAIFSTGPYHHKFFAKVLSAIQGRVAERRNDAREEYFPSNPAASNSGDALNHDTIIHDTPFSRLDERRFKKVPENRHRLKVHPLYIAESMCRRNEAVFPKRTACGRVDGEPVYSRRHLKILRTEKGWWMLGRRLRRQEGAPKPYRKVRDKRYYADFQTEPVVVSRLYDHPMEYFHENFVPAGCCYVNCKKAICDELDIKSAECVVGLRRGTRVIRGVFVSLADRDFLCRIIEDRNYYAELYSYIRVHERMQAEWRQFASRIGRFVEINESLGLQ